MLATPQGRTNGLAFTGGWVLALTAVVTAVILAGSGAGATGADGPAPWPLRLKLALGLLFLLLGTRQWKGRRRRYEVGEGPGDRQLPQPERAHPQRRRFPERLTAPRSLSDATT
ncbi:GAP family protein [Streptomyces anulatus]|uniref:GAP family protein n=1 Tax=Streptomyces anulatus TaxID=1892 RepID=UPI0033F80BF5